MMGNKRELKADIPAGDWRGPNKHMLNHTKGMLTLKNKAISRVVEEKKYFTICEITGTSIKR